MNDEIAAVSQEFREAETSRKQRLIRQEMTEHLNLVSNAQNGTVLRFAKNGKNDSILHYAVVKSGDMWYFSGVNTKAHDDIALAEALVRLEARLIERL